MTQADATPLYIEEKGDGTYTITNGPTDLEDLTHDDVMTAIRHEAERFDGVWFALHRAKRHFMETRRQQAIHDWDQIASKWEGGEYRIETTSPKAAE